MRGKTAVTSLLVACALLLSGCLPFGAVRTEPSAAPTPVAYSPGTAVTSPNGAVSITLPTGWNDLTFEYFEALPDSVLIAFWSRDNNLRGDGPFATVSTHLTKSTMLTAQEQAQDRAESWIAELDGEIVGDDSFLTDSGDTVAWANVVGEMNGTPTSIHAIAIVGEEVSALILLETYPDQDGVGLEFLDALPSIQLKAADAANVYRADDGSPVDLNGRWFSYEGGVSIETQAAWTYFATGFDDLGATANDPTDFVGMWWADGDRMTATYSVMLIYFHSTGFDAAYDDPTLPDVGEVLDNIEGRLVTGTDGGEYVLDSGARVLWRDSTLSEAGETLAFQRVYVVETGEDSTLLVNATYFDTVDDAEWAKLEAAIATAQAE